MSASFPETIAGYPFLPIEFDKKARLLRPAQFEGLRDHVAQTGTSDLLVLSHGWNNDEEEALALYKRLLRSVAEQDRGRLAGRTLAVAGVFWPSKKFADSDVIPGGAAGLGGDLPEARLVTEIEAVRGFFDVDDEGQILSELTNLVPELEDDPAARRRFGELAQSLLGAEATSDIEVGSEMPKGMLSMPGEDLIDALSTPRDEEIASSSSAEGGIAAFGSDTDPVPSAPEGGAAFLGSLFAGTRSGARNVLNLFTYFQMKSRAGAIGLKGLEPPIRAVLGEPPNLRLHFVGHSFGGRLVTACVHGDGSRRPVQARSMTLLQAAFSHNGFAEDYKQDKDGFFRQVTAAPGLPGPILVTHTSKDLPNRWAYPMASRLARHQAATFGGPDDVYGAIGSNGAQHTPEAESGALLATSGVYQFEAGNVYNLESSDFISGHGDVTGPEVAHALISAVISG